MDSTQTRLSVKLVIYTRPPEFLGLFLCGNLFLFECLANSLFCLFGVVLLARHGIVVNGAVLFTGTSECLRVHGRSGYELALKEPAGEEVIVHRVAYDLGHILGPELDEGLVRLSTPLTRFNCGKLLHPFVVRRVLAVAAVADVDALEKITAGQLLLIAVVVAISVVVLGRVFTNAEFRVLVASRLGLAASNKRVAERNSSAYLVGQKGKPGGLLVRVTRPAAADFAAEGSRRFFGTAKAAASVLTAERSRRFIGTAKAAAGLAAEAAAAVLTSEAAAASLTAGAAAVFTAEGSRRFFGNTEGAAAVFTAEGSRRFFGTAEAAAAVSTAEGSGRFFGTAEAAAAALLAEGLRARGAAERRCFSEGMANSRSSREIDATSEMLSNRAEVLRLLLVLLSKTLYMNVASTLASDNPWAEHMTVHAPKAQVLPILCSMLNTAMRYDPDGWGLPYDHMLVTDHRETVVALSLQTLNALLDYHRAAGE
ncbi:MAG: high-temperature-induced dauer-formation protein-domain-containing protein, partial [Olpidium bornovanus]